MLRGRLLDRPALDTLLAGVERDRWRLNGAAMTLFEAMLAMLPAGLYVALGAVVLGLPAFYLWRRRIRKRAAAPATAPAASR